MALSETDRLGMRLATTMLKCEVGVCGPTFDVDHLVTAEEFALLQDSDHRWELVEGRVFTMSPPGARHGVIAVRLARA